MRAESTSCCSASSWPAKRGNVAGLGVALGIAALLVPKCPVCVAGLLAVIGLGAGVSGIAAWVGAWGEPLGWAILAASGLVLVARGLGPRRRW